jgi:choline dehydrogenase-like flavoprotein
MNATYDFIIVGGGSAGCVLANRLSAKPTHRVLLVEAGPDDESFLIRMPKGFGKLLSDPRHCYFYGTNHVSTGGGRPDIWVRGKVLGGSSAVNGMVYHHGQPQDYDNLAAAGLKGWGWNDIARCFASIEDHRLPATPWRGRGGPIPIRLHPTPTRLSEAMIAAGGHMGLERKQDPNLPEQEGVSYVASNIDRRGQRVSAARGFLTPGVRRRPNLTILTETHVERILFEGTRAVGVACVRGTERAEYRASREVILSAGTIASPHLLQVSGVGPAKHLQGLGVPVVYDSPGVGANLREHWLAFTQFRLRDWQDSQNREFAGFPLARQVVNYLLFRRGPLSIGGYDVVAFVRTRPGLDRPDAQLMYAPYSLDMDAKEGAAAGMESEPGMQFFGYPMRGTSQGTVLIGSAAPRDPPQISPNYLATEYDRLTTVSTVRYIRSFMQQAPLEPFVVGELPPTSLAQSDDEILDMVKAYGSAGLHAVGTCRMGSDPLAVLDERLRVHGVAGLRVVDCSIFPEQLSGNTNAPVMAAAWRASELLLEDHT